MTDEAPGFWLFSLALYSQPDVEQSCLELQNRFNADVNLLLWCGWLAWDHGLIVTLEEIDGADSRVKDWRDSVLKPLRQARLAARGVDESYQALKEAELEAERHAQSLINQGCVIDEGVGEAALGMRLSQAHQAMRNYLVGWLGVEEGEASPHITQLLNGLKAL